MRLSLPEAQNISEIDRKIIDRRWVYINRDIKWELLPKTEEKGVPYVKEWDAVGQIVIFYPSGEYAEVLVSLWKQENPHRIFFAPNGEAGYMMYRGKWLASPDGTISTLASYSHVGGYRVQPSKTPKPHRRNWSIRQLTIDCPGTSLETNGEVFVPASEVGDEDIHALTYFVKDLE